MSTTSATPTEVIYPDSDGQPTGENTLQYEWIGKITDSLMEQYANDASVFVAGDLFWYPVQGHPAIRVAPDTLVVIGRPKGHRLSYRQWDEGGIAPQVVFEVRSPSNTDAEMDDKLDFYETYGVEEYYLYDPHRVTLDGWQRTGTSLVLIPQIHNWISPRLQIRFDMSTGNLIIYHPNGRPFLSPQESRTQRREAEERVDKLAQQLRSLGIEPEA